MYPPKSPYPYEEILNGHVIFENPISTTLQALITATYQEHCEEIITWVNDRHFTFDFIVFPASGDNTALDYNSATEMIAILNDFVNLPQFLCDVDLRPTTDYAEEIFYKLGGEDELADLLITEEEIA